MARKIYAVISGMEKVRIDNTTEEELLKITPSLKRSPYENHSEAGVERYYTVEITNERDWEWVIFRPIQTSTVRELLARILDWCGYRYMHFAAGIHVLNGKVSSLSFGISQQLGFPRPVFDMVAVKSVHAFWTPHRYPFSVFSLDDESPQFRIRGWGEENSPPYSLSVTYTSDAPAELVAHVFQIDLSCFWSVRGCRFPAQMAPNLWENRNAVRQATVTRLLGPNPCPDRVLESRVRYLLDVNVLLLEVTSSTNQIPQGSNEEDSIHYRLKKVIRGDSSNNFWQGVQWPVQLPSPVGLGQTIPNHLPRPKPGDEILYFGGELFETCRFVPAASGSLAAVMNAFPAVKRPEDQVSLGGLL
jgi:hypothetical protein